jgi:glycosyltransferase involved in cell wall biosynthesis|tara:strand:+ start:12528 stop:13670 length:1143 start_codon:yes stop_codon:yes gene_type:complete
MISLAHHWLVAERGGEKVLQSFSTLFPESDIYTLVATKDRSVFGDWLSRHRIVTSPLQHFPNAAKRYKMLLPLFPLSVAGLKAGADTALILSSDASVIKGLAVPQGSIHVCYCHSPPRYLWSMQETYLQQSSGLGALGRLVFRAVTPYVRWFDRRSAQRVDHFIANSRFVANRIKRCYDRESTVIYPPVAVDDFICSEAKEDFYLIVSELVPYKRIDLAVEAFNRNGKRLVIIGDGSERMSLQAKAAQNIEFLGRQPFPVLKNAYSKCRAFIFPGIEDFGITPLEAQASGSPVIAFGEGGALETVVAGKTGLFFEQQTSDGLFSAVESFEACDFDPNECRQNAERFSELRFREEIKQLLMKVAPDALASHVWTSSADCDR